MKYAIALMVLCFSAFAYAQDNDLPETDSDAAKYLDDGIKFNASNFVSLSAGTLLSGYADLEYERKITPNFALQVGGLYRLFEGVDLWESMMDAGLSEANLPDTSSITGVGFSGAAKLYVTGRGITDKYFYSLNFKNRTESTSNVTYTRNDFYFSQGIKKIYKNNFGMEISQGVGFRMMSTKYEDNPDFNELYPGFLYLWTFKFGYYF